MQGSIDNILDDDMSSQCVLDSPFTSLLKEASPLIAMIFITLLSM